MEGFVFFVDIEFGNGEGDVILGGETREDFEHALWGTGPIADMSLDADASEGSAVFEDEVGIVFEALEFGAGEDLVFVEE